MTPKGHAIPSKTQLLSYGTPAFRRGDFVVWQAAHVSLVRRNRPEAGLLFAGLSGNSNTSSGRRKGAGEKRWIFGKKHATIRYIHFFQTDTGRMAVF